MAQSVGFIGLGLMGEPMALNLTKAGFKVTAFNRTRSKAESLEKAGATIATSAADAAREADVVIIIVSDTAAVEEVVLGKGGVLESVRPGSIVMDSSTISPAASRKFACHTAGKQASWLDAPVTGSKHGAAKGELTFMIGGEREVMDRAMPVLQVLGKRHIYCGTHGAGLSVKLAQNVIQASMVEVFSEAAVMVTKAGVRPEALFELIQASMARSPLLDFKIPFIFKGDFTPYFALKLMHKDLELALENAYAQNVSMPAAAAVKEIYGAVKAQGKGEMDYAVVVTLFEEITGVKVRADGQ